ncbi:transposase [Nocardia uniformis]|uniref:transposase n=1 Tax=Nocardia uniformis TaxID=53432 RepID=UPI001FDFB173|nr:transposase [Nocardia uniformis]
MRKSGSSRSAHSALHAANSSTSLARPVRRSPQSNEGMEDQLSAQGLVLNCLVLWNTVYSDRALEQLRAQDYPVREEDAARLSAFIPGHIGIDGHHAFHLPDLGGTHRPLRDPDTADD